MSLYSELNRVRRREANRALDERTSTETPTAEFGGRCLDPSCRDRRCIKPDHFLDPRD